MKFDFFPDSNIFYEESRDVFPVKITKYYREDPINNKPFVYAVAYRLDNASEKDLIVLLPPYEVFEEGDILLVRKIQEGFSVFIQKLYTKIFIYDNKRIDYTQFPRFIPNQFLDGKVFGRFFNESTFYNSFVLEYLKREPDFLYKRFVTLPKFEIYKSFNSVFEDEPLFASIVDDKGTEIYSRRHIFHHSENPINKKELISLNPHKGFPYRGDVVFDSLHEKSQKYKTDKILKIKSGEELPEIEEKIPKEKDETEETLPLFLQQISLYEEYYTPTYNKLPNWFDETKYSKSDILPEITAIDKVPENIKYSSYDEILSVDKFERSFYKTLEEKNRFIPYRFDIFYPKETKTIKIGRNKIFLDIYDREEERTIFTGIKTEKDQQIALLDAEINQVRIRGTKSVFLMEDNPEENYTRTILKNYKNSIIETLQNFDKDYAHIILVNTKDITPLEDGSNLNEGSYIFLLRNKDDDLKRTLLEKETSEYSSTIGAIKNGVYAFQSIKANASESEILQKTNSTFIKQNHPNRNIELSNNTDKINIRPNNIDIETTYLNITGITNIQGSLTVLGSTAITGGLTVNGKIAACFGPSGIEPC